MQAKRQLRGACNLTLCLLAVGSLAAAGESASSGARWTVGTPIVTYWAGPVLTDAVANQMAEGGWNLVWSREQDLDTAHRHGLRALVTNPGCLHPSVLDNPDQRRQLDSFLERVSRHPATYAYYLTDEPGAAAFPAWGKLVAYLRERDPAHLAYINLFPTYASNEQLGTKGDTVTAYREHLRLYLESVKPALVSYDHYQFAADGDLDGYFLNLAMVRDAARGAGVPFLNIVQACSWTPVRRVPDADEMRYLVYTTLAYGAQGISYYVYCHPGHTGGIANPDGGPTPLYRPLQTLNREFAAIAAQLQPLQSAAVYHLGMLPAGAIPLPADAAFRLQPPIGKMAYRPGERARGAVLGLFGPDADPRHATHVLVVNLDYRSPLATRFAGPRKIELFSPATSQWSGSGASDVALELLPGGGLLLRLAP